MRGTAAPGTQPRPALFLDRDGTIVEEVGHLCRPGDVRLIAGAATVIARANARKIPVIVVTNQSGIGRGLFGWAELIAVEDRIEAELAAYGARIDAVLACPFHRDGQPPYQHPDHPARKPNAGLLLRARSVLAVDLAASWIIGDRAGDIRYGAFVGGGVSWPGWQPIFPGTHAKWGGEPVPGSADCNLAISGEECTACPNVGITPLQHAKAAIRTAVGALSATGNTNIPAGLGWAWRVLKPEPPFTEAVADPPYVRDQAIVLLTDGENCANSGDAYKRVFGSCSGGRAKMDARLRTLAANIKADNVIIYVVQFANAGTALQTLLKDVASGPNAPYYHYAPSAAELKKVFREIANHLSELRLSK